MTVSASEIALYAWALLILFLTPGPVWMALTARAVSGGFGAAWPLALGVAVGDVVWPLAAILGVTWLVSLYADFLIVLRYLGVGILILMGVMLIRHADANLSVDSRLTKPGFTAGFGAGLLVILGNPKAILFYMGILPLYFDVTRVQAPDIALICLLSAAIPLAGNVSLALALSQARAFLASGKAVRRTNQVAGVLLIGVAGFLLFQ